MNAPIDVEKGGLVLHRLPRLEIQRLLRRKLESEGNSRCEMRSETCCLGSMMR